MQIRRATNTDIEILQERIAQLGADPEVDHHPEREHGRRSVILRVAATDERFLLYLAEENGVVRGYGILRLDDGSTELPDVTGMIYDLFVFPDARRRGIGTALLRYLMDVSAQACYTRLRLMVDLDNGPALGLYRRLGFRAMRAEMYRNVVATDRFGSSDASSVRYDMMMHR